MCGDQARDQKLQPQKYSLLKIKNYLQSSIYQEQLDIIAIKSEVAKIWILMTK
jgi:hypothetical protein